jgi:hypothetical protein
MLVTRRLSTLTAAAQRVVLETLRVSRGRAHLHRNGLERLVTALSLRSPQEGLGTPARCATPESASCTGGFLGYDRGGAALATRKSPKRATAVRKAAAGPPPPRKALSHPVKQIAAKDAALVERLRKICLGFPEAGERLSHGEPTWFAGKGKVFAMLDNHHHGSAHLSVWLPQPMDVQGMLIEADPRRFFRPPYVGPSGWVGVVLDTKPDWELVQRLVYDAFVFVATKKLLAQLD